jgi:glucose-1-phosphate thymidylyltransferase
VPTRFIDTNVKSGGDPAAFQEQAAISTQTIRDARTLNNVKFILPAAGKGSRLAPSRVPKELLPITYSSTGGRVYPRPVIEYSIEAMRLAGIRSGSIVINTDKAEILRYLGNGSHLGVSLLYGVQSDALGLPHAIDIMYNWVANSVICMALPDTIYSPQNAPLQICRELMQTNADLVLGVFPTQRARHLGPVLVTTTGAVLDIQDKPDVPVAMNTWGIAAWGPRLTELIHCCVSATDGRAVIGELALGAIFNQALREGYHVRAIHFDDGLFIDVGTPEGIHEALLRLLKGTEADNGFDLLTSTGELSG